MNTETIAEYSRRCYACCKHLPISQFGFADAFCSKRKYICPGCSRKEKKKYYVKNRAKMLEAIKKQRQNPNFSLFIREWFHWMKDRHPLLFTRRAFYRWALTNEKLRKMWLEYKQTSNFELKPMLRFYFGRKKGKCYTLGNILISTRQDFFSVVSTSSVVPIWGQVERKKEVILSFLKREERRPSGYGNKEERQLYTAMRNYMSPSDSNYDEKFKQEVHRLRPSHPVYYSQAWKEKLLNRWHMWREKKK